MGGIAAYGDYKPAHLNLSLLYKQIIRTGLAFQSLTWTGEIRGHNPENSYLIYGGKMARQLKLVALFFAVFLVVPGCAPERNKVGEGYLITGAVLSADGCNLIPGAQIEVWLAGPDGEYRDDYRATFFADGNGAYTFESHVPPSYSNRPPHHHFRISAAGFETLVTQHYPQPGETQASFDLVLVPNP
jgi:hypothetical protein